MVQFLHLYMTTGKTMALTIWTFAENVMPLFFKVMFSFVIAFLIRNKHLLISRLLSLSEGILETSPTKNLHCFYFFPFYLSWSDGTRCNDLSLLNVFKPAFSVSSFTLIKRFHSSSSFSAIRVISSTYLRLLIFLLAILIPAWDSSSPAFHMIYSAYKFNKLGNNIRPWCTLFPILNQPIVPCPVLTVLPDLRTGFSGGR